MSNHLRIKELLDVAKQRAAEKNLHYAGALTPQETWELLQLDPDAVLVDVRTQAEADWVGYVAFSEDRSFHIEWNTYPEGKRNPDFLNRLQASVDNKNAPILFLCRSGARSHNAAALATEHGYTCALNILEGFEGDKDAHTHRSSVNGWRVAGLPWQQH